MQGIIVFNDVCILYQILIIEWLKTAQKFAITQEIVPSIHVKSGVLVCNNLLKEESNQSNSKGSFSEVKHAHKT